MKLNDSVLDQTAPEEQFASLMGNRLLVERLFKTMKRQEGIGLSATQVGKLRRVFVMDINGERRACWNPQILEASPDQVEMVEGCLSFPGESCKLKRAATVKVRYQLCNGVFREETLTGLTARCFQHELDHLNGITMLHRLKEQNEQQS